MEQSVRGPNPIDIHVGSRVRMRRTLLGMTQTGLGDAIGLTFQQVQKYERGLNRIGSSRLYDLARVLDVPVSFFFDDMPETVANKSPALVRGLAPETSQAMVEFDPQLVSKRILASSIVAGLASVVNSVTLFRRSTSASRSNK